MGTGSAPRRLATFEDLLALPEDARCEVIGGVVVEKASPSADHGDVQLGIGSFARERFHRGGDDRGPGGWWIMTEVDVELGRHDLVRPDVVGWRRDRVPAKPRGRPVRDRPDWICEVLSPSNASTDLVDKFRLYAASGVPHYWIADPERAVLTVYRLGARGYEVALQAKRGELVRAEPFEAVESTVDALFGDEE
jgi:Uma2 family endonuclease